MDKNNKWKQSLTITGGLFRQEGLSCRVVMGYLLGIAVLAYWMSNFFNFVHAIEEPINVLETFVVVEHHSLSILFLVLGWLLVMADAPFIKANTYFMLYRTSKKCWNMGMLMYILTQAFLYVFCLAAATVIAGGFIGFFGNIWSSPAYILAMDDANDFGVEYNISFHYARMMNRMTVPQAFGITFLFLFCYLAFLGVLLYVCNLLLQGIWGVIIVLGMHLTGYLFLQDGWINKSLLAHAIPGYFMDGTNGYWLSPCMYLFFILVLSCIAMWKVQKIDFRESAEVDS